MGRTVETITARCLSGTRAIRRHHKRARSKAVRREVKRFLLDTENAPEPNVRCIKGWAD